MMSLWDALRMNMMISYQELVRTFPRTTYRLDELVGGICAQSPPPHASDLKILQGKGVLNVK